MHLVEVAVSYISAIVKAAMVESHGNDCSDSSAAESSDSDVVVDFESDDTDTVEISIKSTVVVSLQTQGGQWDMNQLAHT